ncbi:MAG: excinuclease ABC subunit UvrB [Deltaproteobacteria bacterium]|nr:excinuclease ABC subunit UvrB [Deltaproteobacteria bacterium]
MSVFQLRSSFTPTGDQPKAIAELTRGIDRGDQHQVLVGITGSGKTFTVANVIQHVGAPTLIMAPNKTLAAQLYSELRELFPENAVEYFVSYFDYYQPEAYVPSSDTYIEKDSIINDAIDRMRHSATRSLLSRRDVIIVASVSCIYGIGAAETYFGMRIDVKRGEEQRRDEFLRQLVEIQYSRNDVDFHRGTFRVRGDVVEVFPANEQDTAIRVEFFGDEVEAIKEVDPMRGVVRRALDAYSIYPGSHYVAAEDQRAKALQSIRTELKDRLIELELAGKLLERQRLEQRTMYDLEMLEQVGFCTGIENYSRHFSSRAAGEPPPTLIDYFPPDFLLVLDESHQTVPQIGAMYVGDHNRKQVLVDYGFRLPSALDNRPLKWEEFQKYMRRTIFVSATPGDYELERTEGVVVEQVIRPTGLLDPVVHVRPVSGQVDDLLAEIRARAARSERVLVTTLTKRMAEDLTEYYRELGVRVRYLHSDVDTLERIDLLRDLRRGEFDVLVGINLLREGLDLPEVSLVAILDADKEGFLRSPRSLIQTIGRAARNAGGEVIMYADKVTAAMKHALDETARRRTLQQVYNAERGIVPQTIVKPILEMAPGSPERDYVAVPRLKPGEAADPANVHDRLELLREQMLEAAEALDFERAAALRDELRALEKRAGVEAPPAKGSGAYAGGVGSAAYGGSAATAKKRTRTAVSRRRR